MVTAVEIRGYEPLFTEDNRRLCGCLAPLLSLPASQAQTKYPVLHHSIAHSSLFPTSMYLHWHFRPKKWFFWNKKFLPPKKYFFLPFLNATFQWGPRKSEKAGLKSCSAQTLFSTVQPRPQPTAQNWFSILWNLGTRHLFSYLCPALMDTFVVHSDLRILFLASCKYGTYKSCRPGFWKQYIRAVHKSSA